MEKTLIAIPTLDTVPALFAHSLACMIRPETSRIVMLSNSLVYTARNALAAEAIQGGYKRVLWLDSDMAFRSDLMLRLNKHLDEGKDFITALYFKRVQPTAPIIYTRRDGKYLPFTDYPENAVFHIAGAGMGACMMTVDMLEAVAQGGLPFTPESLGEDLEFCRRAIDKGYSLFCDSSIEAGHVGVAVFNERMYKEQLKHVG